MAELRRRDAIALLAGAIAAPICRADADALGADADLLGLIYRTLHPGLYRYQSAAQFDQACSEFKALLQSRPGLAQCYLGLSKLLARLRCGHSYANFFNQSKSVSAALIEPANKLPLHFVWLGDRMIVAANPLGLDGVARGDEILAVNGHGVGRIQDALLPLMRADGANDGKRRALLNVLGDEKIESFDVFFPLVFPDDSGRFVLDLANGRRITVAAIDQSQRLAMAAQNDMQNPDFWSLRWPAAGVAMITMPSWAMYKVTWDWRARIAAMFEEIAGRDAKGLIIDLRRNEGGEDCGDALIAHLIDTPLALKPPYRRLVRFRSTPAELDPYLDSWDSSFRHLGEGAREVGDGFLELPEQPGAQAILPRAPRFSGKTIIFSSAQNSSATFNFIAEAQRRGIARIYGQTTGGNQRGINGGSFFFICLPNSGLEVDLPLVGQFPLTPKPDAGLSPDLSIEPTQADVAAGRDAVLERALHDLT